MRETKQEVKGHADMTSMQASITCSLFKYTCVLLLYTKEFHHRYAINMKCSIVVFVHHLSKKIHEVYGGSFETSGSLIGRVAFLPIILFPKRTDEEAFEFSSWQQVLSLSPKDSSRPVSIVIASSCLLVNKSVPDTVLFIAVFLLNIDSS